MDLQGAEKGELLNVCPLRIPAVAEKSAGLRSRFRVIAASRDRKVTFVGHVNRPGEKFRYCPPARISISVPAYAQLTARRLALVSN